MMYYKLSIDGFLLGLLHAGYYEGAAKLHENISRDRLKEVMKLTKVKLHLAVFFTLITFSVFGQSNSNVYLYVGSFTSGEAAEGIVVYDFNTNDGKLTEVERKGSLINPSVCHLLVN